MEHGHVNILLLLKNIKGEIICSDTVRAVINVDRLPGDGFKTLRNRINASKNKPNLEGIEAKLEGEKPLITWGKPRKTTTTSYWISLQDYGGATGFNGWLQTGVRVIKRSNGTESEEHYFEFVPNYNGYNLPPGDPDFDRDGYQIFQKRGGAWKGGKFKVEITDKPNDKVEVFFDDNSWKSAVHADISTLDFENYQIFII